MSGIGGGVTLCLRMAAANSYSEEPLLGVVTHTARPKTLATDEGMRACVQFRHTEMMPTLAKLVEAVKRLPDTSEATEPLNTAYSLAFEDSFFEHKEKRSDYMTRFVSFASAFASDGEADTAQSIVRIHLWWHCLGVPWQSTPGAK